MKWNEVKRFRADSYSRMCCSIMLQNKAKGWAHAVSGFVHNDKGYIFDSNQRKIFPCSWWLLSDFNKGIREVTKDYPKERYNDFGFYFIMYARKAYVNSISPSCLMKYRTPLRLGRPLRANNSLPTNENMNLHKYYPAARIEVKRARAKLHNNARLASVKGAINSRWNALGSARKLLRNYVKQKPSPVKVKTPVTRPSKVSMKDGRGAQSVQKIARGTG